MYFSLNKRFATKASCEQILIFLEDEFKKVAEFVTYNVSSNSLTIKSINTTFGSINRDDTTIIEVKDKDKEIAITAFITYGPSAWFWVFIILGLFTWLLWLVPLVMYFYQKDIVKISILEVFNIVENEFKEKDINNTVVKKSISIDNISDQLEKFAQLAEKGFITKEEYEIQKEKLLNQI